MFQSLRVIFGSTLLIILDIDTLGLFTQRHNFRQNQFFVAIQRRTTIDRYLKS